MFGYLIAKGIIDSMRNNANYDSVTKMKFIGTDTVLSGKLIEHGKKYTVRHANRRTNGWLWIDIYVDGTRVPCAYKSIETFLDNWEYAK